MKLKEYIALNRSSIESDVKNYLQMKQVEYKDNSLYLESIARISETVTSGKLVRGILILLAFESRTKTITSEAIKLATAIEIFHTGLLIHDDIMDNDYLRRGKPTVYAKAIEDGKKNHITHPIRYGAAIATCIGDLAFFMAYEIISKLEDFKTASHILKLVSSELQKVGYAQITDIHFGASSLEPTEEEILSLYRFKTARYSFSLPLKLGGLLSGLDENSLQKFDKFGEELGIAFQIKDDELGIYGDENAIGKPIGSDIRENKKTLFRFALFKSVDETTKSYLKNIFGKKNLTSSDLHLVKKYAQKSNVLDYIQTMREKRSSLAKNILHSIDMPDEYISIFMDLIDFTNNRIK